MKIAKAVPVLAQYLWVEAANMDRFVTYGQCAERIGAAPNGLGPVLRAIVDAYPSIGCGLAAHVVNKTEWDVSHGWSDHTHNGQPCPFKDAEEARKHLAAVRREMEFARMGMIP
jgi:hypothetical protein